MNLKESKILSINKQLQKMSLLQMIAKAVKGNSETLKNLLRDQMRSGKDADGDARDYTSMAYAMFKKDLPSYRAPFGKVDRYLTGKFQAGITLKINGSSADFWSSDSKTEKIVNMEGNRIFVLNPDQMTIARSIVQGDIANDIKKMFE